MIGLIVASFFLQSFPATSPLHIYLPCVELKVRSPNGFSKNSFHFEGIKSVKKFKYGVQYDVLKVFTIRKKHNTIISFIVML